MTGQTPVSSGAELTDGASTQVLSRVLVTLGLVLVLAGVAARFVAAARADFWFDEIWSWWMASDGHPDFPRSTFGVRHDNNHLLNTWIIQALGQSVHWFWYRFPATVAGIGSIGVCGWLARPWGAWVARLTGLLAATSYLMIEYSSEARGYAYLLLCVPLSVCLLRVAHDSDRAKRAAFAAVAFALVATLGCVAQATFYFCFVACLGFTLADFFERGRVWKRWLWVSLVCYLGPSAFATWLYLDHYRGMKIGGGVPAEMGATIAEFFSLTGGGPSVGWGMWLFAGWVVAASGFGLCLVVRRDRRWAPFFVLLIGTLLVTSWNRPDPVFYCRYMLVWAPFVLLTLCVALGTACVRGGAGKMMAVSLVIVTLVGNGYHTVELLVVGRGDYLAAFELMVRETPSHQLNITSTNDNTVRRLITFYRRYLPSDVKINYYNKEEAPAEGVDWVLLTNDTGWPFGESDATLQKRRYNFIKVFRHAGLSGTNLGVFRRDPMSRP